MAKDAAVEYQQLLSIAFSLTKVLSSLVQHDPRYDSVVSLFNATAPALASAAPPTCVQALQLAPAAVIRQIYPLRNNQYLLGLDLFGDPALAPIVRYAVSDPDLTLEGPLPHSSASGDTAMLLVVRKSIHVPVTDQLDTFGRPDRPNPLCGPPCDYNASSGTKFWGTAAVRLSLDSLRVPMGNLMVSVPLRPLAAMGYRYALVASVRRYGNSTAGGGDAATARAELVMIESSLTRPHGDDVVTTALELGSGVQWSLLVGPSGSSWMPAWYGGVVAGVVVLALVASLLLFWLLVSRRRHQMLLCSLLPAELLRGLQVEADAAPLEPKTFTSESPADVLMGLLAALLAGQLPDLRDVVMLRTVLRKRQDVYRPINLGSRLRDANLDSDVAYALMRQLGDAPPDLLLTFSQQNFYQAADSARIAAGAMAAANGEAVGGGGADVPCVPAANGMHMRVPGSSAVAPTNGCSAAGSQCLNELLLSSLQQREQQLMADCHSITGALAYILSAGTALTGEPLPSTAGDPGPEYIGGGGGPCPSAPGSVVRRQELAGTAANLEPEEATLDYASGGGGISGGMEVSGVCLNPLASTVPPAVPQTRTLQQVWLRSSAGLHIRPISPLLGFDGSSGLDGDRRGTSPLFNIKAVGTAPGSEVTISTATVAAVATARFVASDSHCSSSLALGTSGGAVAPPAVAATLGLEEWARAPAAIHDEAQTPDEEDQGQGQGQVPERGPRPRRHMPLPSQPWGSSGSVAKSLLLYQQASASTPGDPTNRVVERRTAGLTAAMRAAGFGASLRAAAAAAVDRSRRRSSLGPGTVGGGGGAAGGLTHFWSLAHRYEAVADTSRQGGGGGGLASSAASQGLPSAAATAGARSGGPWVEVSVKGGGGGRGGANRNAGSGDRAESAVAEAAATMEPLVGACASTVVALESPRLVAARAVPPPPPRPLVEEVERLLGGADKWQFDTWGLQEASGGHALSALGFFLMHRTGLVERFRLEPMKLARLLRSLECGYVASNPYHNATHAADVLHTLHVLLRGARLTAHYLDPLGLMAAYFAAIIHDYGHPGLTNDFLVAVNHPLALTYNDRSPLESHHAAAAFRLLVTRPELDVFAAALTRSERAAFRKQVIEMVLATDMKQHFAILNQFSTAHQSTAGGCGGGGGGAAVPCSSSSLPPPPASRQQQHEQRSIAIRSSSGQPSGSSGGAAISLASCGVEDAAGADGSRRQQCEAERVPAPKPLDETERLLSVQVMLKVADLGHLGADLSVHKRWLSVLEEEFFRQGDRERSLGLPISPLFDRAKQGVSKSQVGFYDFVALPLVREVAAAFPGAAPLMHCFTANYDHWRQVETEAAAASAAASAAAAAPTFTSAAVTSASNLAAGASVPADTCAAAAAAATARDTAVSTAAAAAAAPNMPQS